MHSLQSHYRQILDRCLIEARNACFEDSLDRLKIELHHLHEIPNLMVSTNPYRHYDYFRHIRMEYLAWMDANRPEQALRIRNQLGPVWNEMGQFLLECASKKNADGKVAEIDLDDA